MVILKLLSFVLLPNFAVGFKYSVELSNPGICLPEVNEARRKAGLNEFKADKSIYPPALPATWETMCDYIFGIPTNKLFGSPEGPLVTNTAAV